MSRAVPEWRGKTDDTAVPDRVRLRTFERFGGRCTICSRKIAAGEAWTCEHVVAIINGGENRERNLGVTCSWCLPGKNAADVKLKAKSYRVRSKHAGIKQTSRPLPGSKASGLRKRMNGQVERWT